MKKGLNDKKQIPNLFSCEIECCGCSACFSICPVNAIFMKKDKKGFLYPSINVDKCVRCYKCEKVCPINSY